jgi:hypothetical protein
LQMEAVHSLKLSMNLNGATRQNGPKSVNRLVSCTLKYVANISISYCIYKKCSKWRPPCSVRNSQLCDTALQTDCGWNSKYSR